jgi:hypothetical protein
MGIVLAHGALGPYDEIVFVGVILLFAGLMALSWWRGRAAGTPPANAPHPAPPPDNGDPTGDRFELE